MKIKVDILLGFLNSGKTTLINLFLNSGEIEDELVVIIQYENGKEKIVKRSKNVIVIKRKTSDYFDKELLNFILREYMPDRIIIEYNGNSNTKEFIKSFKEKPIGRICTIHKIINVIDIRKANIFFLNRNRKMKNQAINSDIIILNNALNIDKLMVRNLRKHIRHINRSARIIEFFDEEQQREAVENMKLCLNSENEKLNKQAVLLLLCVIVIFIGIILYVPLCDNVIDLLMEWGYIN